jgi:hypothetical protein
MNPSESKKAFTAHQQAAILGLYVEKRLQPTRTANRLGLPAALVVGFLQRRGVLRRRGPPPGTPRKLSVAARRNLEGELATTTDAVLARKYDLSHERVRQIRQELGYPSSLIVRRALAAPARAERREREKLGRKLRRQQRRAKRLLAVNRLSKRWRSGASVAELAQEYGYQYTSMNSHICNLRKEFPEKFPYRQ